MSEQKQIDVLLSELEKRIDLESSLRKRHLNVALLHLLRQHKDEMPALDYRFHKAFRQTDVTDSGHVDMAIWHLISASDIFWECFDRVTETTPPNPKTMTGEQWSNIYRREKEKDENAALKTLLLGMLREVEARGRRYLTGSAAFADVDAIWREVATQHKELKPDGFRLFMTDRFPESEMLFED